MVLWGSDVTETKSTKINQSRSSPNQIPAGNYMFKVSNRNSRKRCEICSELTIKTPERLPLANCHKFWHKVTLNPYRSAHARLLRIYILKENLLLHKDRCCLLWPKRGWHWSSQQGIVYLSTELRKIRSFLLRIVYLSTELRKIRSFLLRIFSENVARSFMKNFIFCGVQFTRVKGQMVLWNCKIVVWDLYEP